MVLGCAGRLRARRFTPHRGRRAVVCVPACARLRWTSSVTSPGAARVARPVCAARRSAAAAARQRRRPVCEAAARRLISPGLRHPFVPRRESQDPRRLHPTRSCTACPGGSVPRCVLWRAAAAGCQRWCVTRMPAPVVPPSRCDGSRASPGQEAAPSSQARVHHPLWQSASGV